MKKQRTGLPAPANAKKTRKRKYTLHMALRDAGITPEEEKYLIEPRIAAAMARAARKELRKAREEAEKQLTARKADLLAEALKKAP